MTDSTGRKRGAHFSAPRDEAAEKDLLGQTAARPAVGKRFKTDDAGADDAAGASHFASSTTPAATTAPATAAPASEAAPDDGLTPGPFSTITPQDIAAAAASVDDDIPFDASLTTGAVSHQSALNQMSSRTTDLTGVVGVVNRDDQPKRGVKQIVMGVVIVAVALALAAAGFNVVRSTFFSDDDTDGTPAIEAGLDVTVTIPDGASAQQIASILVDAGVIDDADDFIQTIEMRGDGTGLKSGTYDLLTGSADSDVIDQLIEGPNSVAGKLTIPEGRTVAQTAAAVEEQLGISADDFIAQAKASNYVADYAFLEGVADDSLEGFLWPTTYLLGDGELTADTVIRAMLDQYQAVLDAHDFSAARETIKSTYGVEMSDYDFLILASIIEREGYTDDDRPLVASVFYNRMQDGMALQSDATMMYVTGGEVTADDLQTDSPYNTYLYTGLTPTPICSPSIESLEAALSPADTDYYYFYLYEDGETSIHEFSETYEEHQAVIAEATS